MGFGFYQSVVSNDDVKLQILSSRTEAAFSGSSALSCKSTKYRGSINFLMTHVCFDSNALVIAFRLEYEHHVQ
jgi:hypothetical protein